MADKKPKAKPETVRKMGKYEFTDPELKELSADLARNCAEMSKLEDEKKEMTSSFKAKIDAATAAVNDYSNKINTGYEHRYFDCIVEKDFAEGTINFVDSRSNVVIESRKMTSEEYQVKTTDTMV